MNTIESILTEISDFSFMSYEQRILKLNHSLNYLGSIYTEKVIYHNLKHLALLNLEKEIPIYDYERLFDFLYSNNISNLISNELKEEIKTYIFISLKSKNYNEKFGDIKDYIFFVDKLIKNINVKHENRINDNFYKDDLFLNIFSHLISCYGASEIYKIRDELLDYGIKIDFYNKISISNINLIFKDKMILESYDPEEFSKEFNVSYSLNSFLALFKDFYDKTNKIHENWLNVLIDKSEEELNFSSFYIFINKNYNKKLEDHFLKNSNNFIKDVYLKKYKIKNLFHNNSSILLARDFKDLLEIYYGHSSKKITKLVSLLCIKENVFDFNYIFLGKILKNLDVNRIHSVLNYIIENKIEIRITRDFFDTEDEALRELVKFFPKKNLGEFLFKKNGPYYFEPLCVFLFKNGIYLDDLYNISLKEEKIENLKDLLIKIEDKVNLLKNKGFDLPIFNKEIENEAIFSEEGLFFVKFPKSNKELTNWGDSLSNCLIYDRWASHVFTRKTIIVGLFDINNEIKYCIEIKKGKINQFEGKDREKPSLYFFHFIENFLIRNGLIKKED